MSPHPTSTRAVFTAAPAITAFPSARSVTHRQPLAEIKTIGLADHFSRQY